MCADVCGRERETDAQIEREREREIEGEGEGERERKSEKVIADLLRPALRTVRPELTGVKSHLDNAVISDLSRHDEFICVT